MGSRYVYFCNSRTLERVVPFVLPKAKCTKQPVARLLRAFDIDVLFRPGIAWAASPAEPGALDRLVLLSGCRCFAGHCGLFRLRFRRVLLHDVQLHGLFDEHWLFASREDHQAVASKTDVLADLELE